MTDEQWFPPDKRFVVTFQSKHRLIDGQWCHQSQRRFVLADNASQAAEHFRIGELSKWNTEFHQWDRLHAQCVPNCAVYTLGYFRFSTDIRSTTTVNKGKVKL